MFYKLLMSDATEDGIVNKDVIGRISSTAAYTIIKGGVQYNRYIHKKAGEVITSSRRAIDQSDVDACLWGQKYQPVALSIFTKVMDGLFKYEEMVTNKMVLDIEKRTITVPDAIFIKKNQDEGYSARVLEIKCPITYNNFIELLICETPADILSANPEYYWQMIDEMLVCGSAVGYFMVYHPDFEENGYRIVEFNICDVKKDMTQLKEAKSVAHGEIHKLVSRIKAIESQILIRKRT